MIRRLRLSLPEPRCWNRLRSGADVHTSSGEAMRYASPVPPDAPRLDQRNDFVGRGDNLGALTRDIDERGRISQSGMSGASISVMSWGRRCRASGIPHSRRLRRVVLGLRDWDPGHVILTRQGGDYGAEPGGTRRNPCSLGQMLPRRFASVSPGPGTTFPLPSTTPEK